MHQPLLWPSFLIFLAVGKCAMTLGKHFFVSIDYFFSEMFQFPPFHFAGISLENSSLTQKEKDKYFKD